MNNNSDLSEIISHIRTLAAADNHSARDSPPWLIKSCADREIILEMANRLPLEGPIRRGINAQMRTYAPAINLLALASEISLRRQAADDKSEEVSEILSVLKNIIKKL